MNRTGRILLSLSFIIFLLLTATCAVAQHLFSISADGFHYYYPQGEKEITVSLAQEADDILQFLERHELTVKAPLHIILDRKLDAPSPVVHVIPHREIRIPLRAPGVFEDGWLESDPWRYFFFKGLCLQAIYTMRSGLPAVAYKGFGEIVSPNVIMPDWITDGVCHLLYSRYCEKCGRTPLKDAILRSAPIPDLDEVSNHPESWPGPSTYRVFGRPFIRWVAERTGWESLHGFFAEHGRGIIPIEIDWKAKQHLGYNWAELWRMYKKERLQSGIEDRGVNISGYWKEPFVYWNRTGVYPGVEKSGHRSRYGFLDKNHSLWLSQYDNKGISKLVCYKGGQPVWVGNMHIWDPGVGGVAVSRTGHQPHLVIFSLDSANLVSTRRISAHARFERIPGPEGVIQLSGPVMDSKGRVFVAGNSNGNWDIWLYEGNWQRITDDPATEIDPWIEKDVLLYASNKDGSFKISDLSGTISSDCETMALLPRKGHYLCLSGKGWVLSELLSEQHIEGTVDLLPSRPISENKTDHLKIRRKGEDQSESGEPDLRYNPLKSLFPNFMQPEVFIDGSEFQLGLNTFGRDVAGDYTLDGGFRYSTEDEYWSLRAGFFAKGFGLRYTRYPFSYATALNQFINESRREVKGFWRPWDSKEVELSANYRAFEEKETGENEDDETWAAVHLRDSYGMHSVWMDLEWFFNGSQSLFGGGNLMFGESIYTMVHLQAGKTWGNYSLGHDTYRVGGNVTEGYFTQRPSRLFPLRGFNSNILDATQAITSGIECFWPLVNIQEGYKTLPLFLHRMMLGTFIDAGIAADPFTHEDILVGGGVELFTSMEVAWGYFSSFRIGVAWPFYQPDYMNEKGPIFLIQIGRPL